MDGFTLSFIFGDFSKICRENSCFIKIGENKVRVLYMNKVRVLYMNKVRVLYMNKGRVLYMNKVRVLYMNTDMLYIYGNISLNYS